MLLNAIENCPLSSRATERPGLTAIKRDFFAWSSSPIQIIAG